MNSIEVCTLLKSTSSKTGKEQILKDNSGNDELKSILQFVFDSYTVTGISTKKISKPVSQPVTYKADSIFDIMDYLKTHNTGTNEDIANVQYFLNQQSQDKQEFYKSIITKSLKIGCDAKTLNKVYGDAFIKNFSVMLANKFWEHKNVVSNSPFIVTQKLDGMRCVVYNDVHNFQAFTRQGQVYEELVDIQAEFKNLPTGFVYDGELIAANPENLLSADLYRKTVSIGRKNGEKHGLIYHVFDVLPIEDFQKGLSEYRCVERKQFLHSSFRNRDLKWVEEVPVLYNGTDEQKIYSWLDYMTDRKLEGVMVNKADAPYSCKRTSDILKVKKMQDADMRITNVMEGTGRNKNKLGAVEVEFETNGEKYTCDCGSGFSDEERIKYYNNPNLIMNKIATIKYFEIFKNDKGTYSLRFPVWTGRIRDEKKEISMN
jgi:DNA ligase-1